MSDESVKAWWESVNESMAWSGAIVALPWDDLWGDAKDRLRDIYAKAISENIMK